MAHTLRIGELSRRVGVTPERLRAWERRYGLLEPTRTEGGFRLYSEADVRRVESMCRLLDRGLAAAEAASIARAKGADGPERSPAGAKEDGQGAPGGSGSPSAAGPGPWTGRLSQALDRYDEADAHAAFDDALAALSPDTVLRDLLAYLADLGQRWADGEVSVSQEHFASHLLRGRLLGLARGWGVGAGPVALLACPPGEQHDLPLIIFGLALRGRGWRIALMGADTPLDTLDAAAAELEPDLLVLASISAERFEAVRDDVAELAGRWPVALAGRGAPAAIAGRTSARHLHSDPVTAAAEVSAA